MPAQNLVANAAAFDPAVLIAVIGTFQVIVVAIIGGLFQLESKRRKKSDEERKIQDDKIEARAKLRAREAHLSMKMASADMSLSVATALAVKEGRTNGKMESALNEADRAQHEYFNFVNDLAARQLEEE